MVHIFSLFIAEMAQKKGDKEAENIARTLNMFNLQHSEEFKQTLADYMCGDGNSSTDEDDADDHSSSDDLNVPNLPDVDIQDTEADYNERPLVPLLQSPQYGNGLDDEEKVVDSFLAEGCGCQRRCASQFTRDVLISSRLDCKALDYYDDHHVNSMHLLLKGSFNALMCDSTKTIGRGAKHVDRERSRFIPLFRGLPVCRKTFMFAHAIGIKTFRNVKNHFLAHGLEAKIHGNVNATSIAKRLPLEMVSRVKSFISNYAEQVSLVLPGRVSSFANADLYLLPSTDSKQKLYTMYNQACLEDNSQPVSLSNFKQIWYNFFPNVVIQKPRTDLCSTCQQNFSSLGSLRTMNEADKTNLLEISTKHLREVDMERKAYQETVAACKQNLDMHPTKTDLQPRTCVSFNGSLHYSFDYAQQIHIPYSSQQVGPLYFLTPYKVALFGIGCEPATKMVIYIVPECMAAGKGSNSVISFLHHFFERYSYGEMEVHLRADNCTGQNKNRYMMAYLCYRIICGLHKKITISFLPVGHTKFFPDMGFGLFKRRFRVSNVNTVDDVATCVSESSSTSKMLHPQLVGNEKGDVFVEQYDWQTKFSTCKPIPDIKKHHSFTFSDEHPGYVRCKVWSNDTTYTTHCIFSTSDVTRDMPITLVPSGLTRERQQYLFDRIREYCPDYAKDVLCPEPEHISDIASSSATTSAPIVSNNSTLTQPVLRQRESSPENSLSLPAPKRKTPTCSYCKESGHRNQLRNGRASCPKRAADIALN